ncbi:hypothetical protein EAL2_808p00050 (plasmid) [Peptoclostridium acidaminophilum DSM 3953]|uniref:UspA domain-containing protein n=1 Tax=Peptoclostridium acidaminophilum DSM 3953 TaxID=1286171 RepID=W8TMT6_PEPAC|nr:universal stress protein [Peptoclostridium acidaminophilum]AHM57512.1 hypothetical protein EAL2_808p00050 [Peptoclostridium acidaminophilum DSM 3953]
MDIRKILLPVDGSECRINFLKVVEDIVLKFNAEITVLNVQHKYPQPIHSATTLDKYGLSNTVLDQNERNKRSIGIVSQMRNLLSQKGIKAQTRVEHGNPAEIIIEIAENEHFDLIIMCSHGISVNKRFLMGSTTNKVLHYATKPVLVVKHEFCKVIDLDSLRKK